MRYSWLLLAAVVMLFGCQPPAEEPAAPEMETEEAEEMAMSDEDMLSALTDAFGDAWGDGDADAIVAMMAADGDMFDPTGEHFRGADAIKTRYEGLFAGMYQGSKLSVTQDSAKFPTPDSAIVRGTYEITSADMSVKGAYTNAAVKVNGDWKLHCIRSMVPIEVPGS